MKETKRVKKTLAREKVKGMFEKIHLRQQLDTIVDPPTQQTHYLGSIIVHEKERFFFLKLK